VKAYHRKLEVFTCRIHIFLFYMSTSAIEVLHLWNFSNHHCMLNLKVNNGCNRNAKTRVFAKTCENLAKTYENLRKPTKTYRNHSFASTSVLSMGSQACQLGKKFQQHLIAFVQIGQGMYSSTFGHILTQSLHKTKLNIRRHI